MDVLVLIRAQEDSMRKTKGRRGHGCIARNRGGLVKGFLAAGYRVVANSRTIEPSPSPEVLTVTGDIACAG
jgi:hypothetical protein